MSSKFELIVIPAPDWDPLSKRYPDPNLPFTVVKPEAEVVTLASP
jgi:hypothetical protein